MSLRSPHVTPADLLRRAARNPPPIDPTTMTTLIAATDHLTLALRAVGTGVSTRPTPCARWTVTDLVEHVGQLLDAGAALAAVRPHARGSGRPGQPSDGPLQRAAATCERIAADWQDALAAPRPAPATAAVPILSLELAVHAWDLLAALAAGGERPAIPEQLAARLLPVAWRTVPASGRGGLYAPGQLPPVEPTPSERLLTYLGRQP